MSEIFTLTNNETEILEVMWRQNRPLTRTEVIDLSPERSWKASSIHILLNNLLDKEAIIVAGFVKTGKGFGRTYYPAVKQDEYEKALIKNLFKKGNLSIVKVIAALLEDEDLDDAALDRILDSLRKLRSKNK